MVDNRRAHYKEYAIIKDSNAYCGFLVMDTASNDSLKYIDIEQFKSLIKRKEVLNMWLKGDVIKYDINAMTDELSEVAPLQCSDTHKYINCYIHNYMSLDTCFKLDQLKSASKLNFVVAMSFDVVFNNGDNPTVMMSAIGSQNALKVLYGFLSALGASSFVAVANSCTHMEGFLNLSFIKALDNKQLPLALLINTSVVEWKLRNYDKLALELGTSADSYSKGDYLRTLISISQNVMGASLRRCGMSGSR